MTTINDNVQEILKDNIDEVVASSNIDDTYKDILTSSDISDAIHYEADARVDIYTKDLEKYLIDNLQEIQEKMEEIRTYNIIEATKFVQYYEHYNEISDELRYAIEELYNLDWIDDITDDLLNEIFDAAIEDENDFFKKVALRFNEDHKIEWLKNNLEINAHDLFNY